MDAKQAGKKWGWSSKTVAKYCREGLIFNAEIQYGKWDIPDAAIKPPMTKKRMGNFLKKLLSMQEGAKLDWNLFGYSKAEIRNVYLYLSGFGYIKNIKKEESDLDILLQSASLTEEGKQFFGLEEFAEVLEKEKRIALNAGVTAGVVKATAEIEMKNKKIQTSK